ncbi:spore germination protein [Paenibacillus ferrarius]|uniref:spore germination protein n=1 Tax=Paenibacillus ferrarius TaxID=1469647 RepID=UPI003D29D6CB
MNTPIFTGNYDLDMEKIQKGLAIHSDLHCRQFLLGVTPLRAALVFVEGLSNKEFIDRNLIRELMKGEYKLPLTTDFIQNRILSLGGLLQDAAKEQWLAKVLFGYTMLLVEGLCEPILIDTVLGGKRDLQEPETEGVVRGPRIGFNEVLADNTALLRRSGETDTLVITKRTIGTRLRKLVAIAYFSDIVDPNLVQEVERRISKIDLDHLPESGYIEQLIEDDPISPFQQVQNTERPDKVIAALLEGRVAILLDGTPFVLIVPTTFSMLLQTPEDYYDRWLPVSFIRVLRFIAVGVALLLPSIYISFISFHPGLIPTKLVISIMHTRNGVPFPSYIEAIMMEVAIEILREAGLRLPKPIGPAMGIVGGLIIGEAAVQAGIVSPILVIVVAGTAITSFTIPAYSAGITFRFLRFFAMMSAALFGLYGVLMFLLLIGSHLVRLKSFGVPYLSPAIPYRISDFKDLLFRFPLEFMKRRPAILKSRDVIRKK